MTPNGQPAFIDTTVDSNTAPFLSQPAIYFGENLSDYAVVATKRSEISYSDRPGRAGHLPGHRRREHGLHVRRLAAFALRFGEINLFTSRAHHRRVAHPLRPRRRARVQLLAPFLDFDSDPYPVIIDGRLEWVIDAYTTTDQYPYAQRADTTRCRRQRTRPLASTTCATR